MKDKQKLTNEITDLKSENKNLNKKITKFETEKLELLARLERLEKIAISETNSKDLATIKLPQLSRNNNHIIITVAKGM